MIDQHPPLREIINANGLRAEKAFGQNFLLDLNITQKIVKQAGDLSGVNVIEIGPGPGGLTRALLASEAKSVTAIEFDERCISALEYLKQDRFRLVHSDALETDCTKIVPEGPRAIIANLPYNIATPLLVNWLKQIHQDQNNYQVMALMFQKEVAERIVAKVSDKAYGRLAVLSQWLCDCRIAITLSPSAFTPPPKVHSSVVVFVPKVQRIEAPFEMVEQITAKAFGQRRKMLRQSLKDHAHYFDELDIEPTNRAENLEPEMFIDLASLITRLQI